MKNLILMITIITLPALAKAECGVVCEQNRLTTEMSYQSQQMQQQSMDSYNRQSEAMTQQIQRENEAINQGRNWDSPESNSALDGLRPKY